MLLVISRSNGSFWHKFIVKIICSFDRHDFNFAYSSTQTNIKITRSRGVPVKLHMWLRRRKKQKTKETPRNLDAACLKHSTKWRTYIWIAEKDLKTFNEFYLNSSNWLIMIHVSVLISRLRVISLRTSCRELHLSKKTTMAIYTVSQYPRWRVTGGNFAYLVYGL